MNIYSIFRSINGEVCSPHQGSVCTFIRTAGCTNACKNCDTPYAQPLGSGKEMSIKEIISEVKTKNVTITGGEPLLQKDDLFYLIQALLNKNKNISIETSGVYPIIIGYPEVSWVMDWKCPSTGKVNEWMDLNRPYYLHQKDFLKFVVADSQDFEEMLTVVEYLLKSKGDLMPKIAVSPINNSRTLGDREKIAEISNWVVENKMLGDIGAIVSLQIHKVIWPGATKEV